MGEPNIYNFHSIVTPSGLSGIEDKKVMEGDAKVLNNYFNQSGRGTERYIFDKKGQKFLGIAHHKRGGKPRDLVWRVKF